MTPGELGGVVVMTLLRLAIPKLFTSCGRTVPGLACIHGVIGGVGSGRGEYRCRLYLLTLAGAASGSLPEILSPRPERTRCSRSSVEVEDFPLVSWGCLKY